MWRGVDVRLGVVYAVCRIEGLYPLTLLWCRYSMRYRLWSCCDMWLKFTFNVELAYIERTGLSPPSPIPSRRGCRFPADPATRRAGPER